MRTDAVHVMITGRVQGVWFRGWTCKQAKELGLSGWVRNCRDGSVEAVFCGEVDAVSQMIERCHDGPPAARVDNVRWQPCEDAGHVTFETRPTV